MHGKPSSNRGLFLWRAYQRVQVPYSPDKGKSQAYDILLEPEAYETAALADSKWGVLSG